MASDAQETLYRIFAALSGSVAGSVSGGAIGSAMEAASGTAPTTANKSSGGGVEQIALDVVKSGFGLAPLVTTLFGLFGGGGDAAPAPLVKYAMPARMNFDAGETASGLTSVDYGQGGSPRSYAAKPSAPAPQVNVTVQAMDARSFLDRSSDIAAAVREAMLNLNSINDVVNDL
jgi:hypothetical protein